MPSVLNWIHVIVGACLLLSLVSNTSGKSVTNDNLAQTSVRKVRSALPQYPKQIPPNHLPKYPKPEEDEVEPQQSDKVGHTCPDISPVAPAYYK